MDFGFTQEQEMLRTSARDLLTTECPPGGSSPSGGPKVITRRRGGSASSTRPAASAASDPSVRRCSQREPGCQSETLA